jgi:hypothetical protein
MEHYTIIGKVFAHLRTSLAEQRSEGLFCWVPTVPVCWQHGSRRYFGLMPVLFAMDDD